MEKIRKEKSKDMKKTNTNFMRQTLSLNKIKTTNGITLIALVITKSNKLCLKVNIYS